MAVAVIITRSPRESEVENGELNRVEKRPTPEPV
jgi:hypothetical protein